MIMIINLVMHTAIAICTIIRNRIKRDVCIASPKHMLWIPQLHSNIEKKPHQQPLFNIHIRIGLNLSHRAHDFQRGFGNCILVPEIQLCWFTPLYRNSPLDTESAYEMLHIQYNIPDHETDSHDHQTRQANTL